MHDDEAAAGGGTAIWVCPGCLLAMAESSPATVLPDRAMLPPACCAPPPSSEHACAVALRGALVEAAAVRIFRPDVPVAASVEIQSWRIQLVNMSNAYVIALLF